VAAHITAASEGGPRYNSELTSSERKSIDNGIWLCQNCATLIDVDPEEHPVHVLKAWKVCAEHEAARALKAGSRPTAVAPQSVIAFRPDSFTAEVFWGRDTSVIVVLCPSDPAKGSFDINCTGHFHLEGEGRVALSDLAFVMKCCGEERVRAETTSIYHYPEGRSGKGTFENALSLEPGKPYKVDFRAAASPDEVRAIEECDEIWLDATVGVNGHDAWLVAKISQGGWVIAT